VDHYRATNSYVSSAFFISLLILSQLILLNLFISMMIENFEQLSIRNDLVSKLQSLDKDTLYEKAREKLR
jgi:hypothetical protein